MKGCIILFSILQLLLFSNVKLVVCCRGHESTILHEVNKKHSRYKIATLGGSYSKVLN